MNELGTLDTAAVEAIEEDSEEDQQVAQEDQPPTDETVQEALKALRGAGTAATKRQILDSLTSQQRDTLDEMAPGEFILTSVPRDAELYAGPDPEAVAKAGRSAMNRGDLLVDADTFERFEDLLDAADALPPSWDEEREKTLREAAAIVKEAERAREAAIPFGRVSRRGHRVLPDGRTLYFEEDNRGKRREEIYSGRPAESAPESVFRPSTERSAPEWPSSDAELLALPMQDRVALRKAHPERWAALKERNS